MIRLKASQHFRDAATGLFCCFSLSTRQLQINPNLLIIYLKPGNYTQLHNSSDCQMDLRLLCSNNKATDSLVKPREILFYCNHS